MCTTCGCGKPKDKHGMKSVAAANKKFSVKNAPKQKIKTVRKKAM
jgi:hypothetical protein